MSDWQPVETAPESVLLLVCEGDEPSDISVAFRFRQHWLAYAGGRAARGADVYGNEYPIQPQPTHWMPLPEPP